VKVDHLADTLSAGRILRERFAEVLKTKIEDWRKRVIGAVTAPSAIFEFIEGWYNLHRLHSSLGYRSPAVYEAAAAA
jgi:transposase InsO family protein